MNRTIATMILLGLGVMAFDATPAMAQVGDDVVTVPTYEPASWAGIGLGLVVLGAGLGIGRIGGSAVEAMARQPELAGTIQTGMIIAAALIEGIGLIAALLCLFV